MKINHNIFLRFEGHQEIGLGAIFKKETIRKILLKLGCNPIAICSKKTEPYLKGIYHGEYKCLESPVYSMAEIEEIKKNFQSPRRKIHIITGLIHAPGTYYQRLSDFCNVLALEDLPTPDLSCWGVVNHSPVIKWHQTYCTQKINKLFLGMNYSLFRDDILDAKKYSGEKLNRILITMGGTNSSRSIIPIIKILAPLHHPMDIIIGPGFSHRKLIEDLALSFKNISTHYYPKYFSKLVAQSPIAISSGGSTLYELYYLNCFPIVVPEDPHEKILGDSLEELQHAICIPMTQKDWEKNLVFNINSLFLNRFDISRMGKSFPVFSTPNPWESLLNTFICES